MGLFLVNTCFHIWLALSISGITSVAYLPICVAYCQGYCCFLCKTAFVDFPLITCFCWLYVSTNCFLEDWGWGWGTQPFSMDLINFVD